MSHKISVTGEKKGINNPKLAAMLRRTVKAALAAEGVACDCEINILLTDDEGIREVNRDMREIDRATDVLSFPMFDLVPGEHPDEYDADPDTGLVPLGDMCISVERAKAQAEEYARHTEYVEYRVMVKHVASTAMATH